MSAGAQLFVVTSMMLVGALGAAYLPYWLRSSGTIREAQIAPISALGAGLLIGCSLGLIIPEGFHSLAGGGGDHAHHHEEGGGGEAYAGLALIFGFLAMMFLEQYQHQDGDGTSHHHHVHHHHHHVPPPQQQQQQLKGQQDIEISLSKSSSAARLPSSNTTTNTTKGTIPTSSSASTLIVGGLNPKPSVAETSAITGLLVHCAADGLALGAAVLAGNAALSLSVGTAMVLHKAPMSFGLATYLMNNNWNWERARQPLAAFALAAPVSSWATYLFLSAIPALTTPTSVALCLLVSGGTFLHAACMHMIPEVVGSQGGGRLCRNSMMALVGGAVLPVVLSWGHHH